MVLYCSWQTAGNWPECVAYLWKWACMKETPGWMLTTSIVFTGFLKGMSELTALKLLKSCTPTSRAAASRIAPTSSSLMTAKTFYFNRQSGENNKMNKHMTFLWILGTGSWGQLLQLYPKATCLNGWDVARAHTHIHNDMFPDLLSPCFQSKII